LRLRGLFIIGVLVVGAWGAWAISRTPEEGVRRFEAHEFAEFRSRYDALRVQPVGKRVEHFRALLEATEGAKLTSGMAETLADFCRRVAASEEESPAVQAEARLVVNTLEARTGGRSPASVESKK